MGSRGPVPKRSNMRHGHSKPEPVTKLPAAPRWVDEHGNIVYGVVEQTVIPCREPVERIYYEVEPGPGIVVEPDPEDGEG